MQSSAFAMGANIPLSVFALLGIAFMGLQAARAVWQTMPKDGRAIDGEIIHMRPSTLTSVPGVLRVFA